MYYYRRELPKITDENKAKLQTRLEEEGYEVKTIESTFWTNYGDLGYTKMPCLRIRLATPEGEIEVRPGRGMRMGEILRRIEAERQKLEASKEEAKYIMNRILEDARADTEVILKGERVGLSDRLSADEYRALEALDLLEEMENIILGMFKHRGAHKVQVLKLGKMDSHNPSIFHLHGARVIIHFKGT